MLIDENKMIIVSTRATENCLNQGYRKNNCCEQLLQYNYLNNLLSSLEKYNYLLNIFQ